MKESPFVVVLSFLSFLQQKHVLSIYSCFIYGIIASNDRIVSDYLLWKLYGKKLLWSNFILYYGICWEGLGNTTVIVSPYSCCFVSDLNMVSVRFEGRVLTT